MPSDDSEYARVQELFRSAESYLELVEQLDGEVVVPAVNQLRYVGYHVLASLSLNGEARAEQIHEAEIHASRAGYDCLEAGILELMLEFQQFKMDFRHISVSEVVTDYLNMCETVNETRDVLSRLENRNHVDMHAELESHFEAMLTITRTLSAAREELNKKVRKQDLGIVYATLTILVAIAGILVAILLK